MPFAGKKCGVAGRLAQLGNSQRFIREPIFIRRREQLRIAIPRRRLRRTDVVGHTAPRRILSGKNTRTRWGANGTRRVSLGEARTVASDAIDVRRFIKPTAVTSEVALPKIVRENENDVRLFRGKQ
jgi:hypothetical protein